MTDLELALAQGGQLIQSGQQDQMTDLQRALAQGGQLMSAPGQARQMMPGSMPTQAEEPGRLEALGRGALQGVSLGFSDEIAGAIGSLFSDKSYSQIRDESRAANEAAKQAHGGYYLGGELGGGLATSLVPGLNIAKGASIAAAAGKSALIGAASGLGASEAQDFSGNVIDLAKGAAFGAAAGAVGQKIGKVISKAPEKAEQDLLNAFVAGDGKAGSATMTVKKLVGNQRDNVIKAAEESFIPEGSSKALTLADIAGKPAKEIIPVIEERLNQVGSQLDQHYQVIDRATGGVSLHNLVNFLDDEAATLAKKPLNEKYVEAVKDIRNSLVNAWGGEDFAKTMEAGKRLDAMGLLSHGMSEDVMVPTKDLRQIVTRLQTRGTQVINPLNPGESTIMKADMAKMMKGFLDTHLDIGAEASPEVLQAVRSIRDINKSYSGLSTILKAVEQRGQKELVGNVSAKGHISNLLGHGGFLGAGIMAAHGNIPGAVAAAAAPKVLEYASKVGPAATKGAVAVNGLVQRLTEAAASGNLWAKAQLATLQGLPNAATVAGSETLGGM